MSLSSVALTQAAVSNGNRVMPEGFQTIPVLLFCDGFDEFTTGLPLPRNSGTRVTTARWADSLLHKGHLHTCRTNRMVFTEPGEHSIGVISLVALLHSQEESHLS